MSSPEFPRLEIEAPVGNYVRNIDFNTESLGLLLKMNGVDEASCAELRIEARVSPPKVTGRLSQLIADFGWQNGGLGLYTPNHKRVALNVPAMIAQAEDPRGFSTNDVFLHELGHAIDDLNGSVLRRNVSRLGKAAYLSAIPIGTLVPAGVMYAETGSVVAGAATSVVSFFGTLFAEVALAEKTHGHATTRYEQEESAEKFVSENRERFPDLMRLRPR